MISAIAPLERLIYGPAKNDNSKKKRAILCLFVSHFATLPKDITALVDPSA